jgi:hypothetical protein
MRKLENAMPFKGNHHDVKTGELDRVIAKINELQTTISELKEAIMYNKKSIADEAYEHAQTRQKVAKLETYLSTKNNGHRRDFDLLAVDLKNEVLKRGRKGLDYNEVQLIFRFKSAHEAYRLMDVTSKAFHEEVRLHNPKSKKQRRKIVSRG